MTDSEYFDQLESIIVIWLKGRNESIGNYSPIAFNRDGWEESMENSRKKTGKTREEFLAHLRVLMLFN